MIEWSPEHKWNSFNSYKGLMYRQQYDAIVAGKFMPPVEVSIDPVNDCQLNCFYCNGKLPKSRKIKMTREHLLELCEFFARWGVKGVCFAGGGEPTMHEALGEAFLKLYSLRIPVSIITNGLFLDEEQMKHIARYSRWVGISVDCSRAETYKQMKGSDRFDEVLKNMTYLIDNKAHEVTYKFLINPINQYEIYDAIRFASLLGCHGIHIRPVSFKNYQKHEEPFDILRINKQIYQGFQDYGDKIKIFAVRHKFDDKMHVKFPFKKCLATPLMPIFSANGDVELCIDRKGDPKMFLCKHDDPDNVLKIWGSDYHKEIISKIDLNDCKKCTIMHLNEQIEKAVIENRTDYEFV